MNEMWSDSCRRWSASVVGKKFVARRGMRMLMTALQERVLTYLPTDHIHSDVSEDNCKRDSHGEREPSMIGGILT